MFSFEWLDKIGWIVQVIVGFGFLIFVHEFGHFIFAKWRGVKVIKFSLGFGPALIQRQIGETVYAISIIPLGGYCKMAGEMLEEKSPQEKEEPPVDPSRLLSTKSVGARAQIFVAGALMNLVAAFPLGVATMLVGGPEPVARVTPGTGKAYEAGISSGDFITSVDGKPVHFWEEMAQALEKVSVNKPFSMTVKRGTEEKTFAFRRDSKDDTLGLGQYSENVLQMVHPASPARKGGLRMGDRIVAVAREGEPTEPIYDWSDFDQIIKESADKELRITVERKGELVTCSVTPVVDKNERFDESVTYGIGAKLVTDSAISVIPKDSPAEHAGLRPGDRVVSVNGERVEIGTDAVSAVKRAGTSIPVTVVRDGQPLDVVVVRPTRQSQIGVAFLNFFVNKIDGNSPAQQAGLQPGDAVLKVDGRDTKDNSVLQFDDDGEHKLEISRDGKEITLSVKPQRVFFAKIGVQAMGASEFYRPPFLTGVTRGVSRTAIMIAAVLDMLVDLFSGKVHVQKLSGPVGIISISYMGAQGGWQQFLRIVTLISISLGIFNLLPVPILDGGHLLFLLIEKAKGKPVSERTLLISQYVGLVLLIGLVLYVTSNDVMNYIL
ncbi:MAG TPA: RIP metalloprotease RseP [Planctomycetota bacterium]|nr:RIP metalloprotease RseP [Planctomycetota bacterium]